MLHMKKSTDSNASIISHVTKFTTLPFSDLSMLFISQRYKVSVYRRYSDFDVFHEVLLQRFAYRVVPAMPPKRMLKGGELLRHLNISHCMSLFLHSPHLTVIISEDLCLTEKSVVNIQELVVAGRVLVYKQ